jgi:hypothetical protein
MINLPVFRHHDDEKCNWAFFHLLFFTSRVGGRVLGKSYVSFWVRVTYLFLQVWINRLRESYVSFSDSWLYLYCRSGAFSLIFSSYEDVLYHNSDSLR